MLVLFWNSAGKLGWGQNSFFPWQFFPNHLLFCCIWQSFPLLSSLNCRPWLLLVPLCWSLHACCRTAFNKFLSCLTWLSCLYQAKRRHQISDKGRQQCRGWQRALQTGAALAGEEGCSRTSKRVGEVENDEAFHTAVPKSHLVNSPLVLSSPCWVLWGIQFSVWLKQRHHVVSCVLRCWGWMDTDVRVAWAQTWWELSSDLSWEAQPLQATEIWLRHRLKHTLGLVVTQPHCHREEEVTSPLTAALRMLDSPSAPWNSVCFKKIFILVDLCPILE